MSLSWYPFYPGDYARDTRDLSCCEHGCYRLLLDHSWANGPLPDDLDRLTRIAANPPPETVRFVLQRYWQQTDVGWINAKLESVRKTQASAHDKKAIAAARTNYKRWGDENSKRRLIDAGVSLSDTISDSPSSRNQNQNQILPTDVGNKGGRRFTPPSLSDVTAYCQQRGNNVDPEAFIDHYTANGWMRGKTKIKDWKACVRTWEKNREKSKRPSEPSFLDTCKDFAAGKLG